MHKVISHGKYMGQDLKHFSLLHLTAFLQIAQ